MSESENHNRETTGQHAIIYIVCLYSRTIKSLMAMSYQIKYYK